MWAASMAQYSCQHYIIMKQAMTTVLGTMAENTEVSFKALVDQALNMHKLFVEQ